jgi:BirA family biotin operon repressor/biotin-[acetyl-CoA-carboxylase] ligase
VSGSLGAEFVVPRLRGRFGRPYVYAEVCPSTQRLLGPEHSEGAVAVAEEQTEGRGRLGKQWVSPRGVSILCSILLEPPVETHRLPELSLVAGEACAEAISGVTGLEPTIKLPNDILLGGQKVAGILAEVRGGRVVLGIGINVNVPAGELPVETEPPATSLLIETGAELDRAQLLVELLVALERGYDRWVKAATGT